MTKARRQIRKGKSSTSSGLRSNFSDDGGYDIEKIPDEDWEPTTKKILKSSQEIRDTYGMSNPSEAKDYDDNRSSSISVGPNEDATMASKCYLDPATQFAESLRVKQRRHPRAAIQCVPNVRRASYRDWPYLLTEGILEPESTRAFQGVMDVGDDVAEGEAFNMKDGSML
ncbi:hypothetical protein LTR72_012461 [Exophiala xenobiotica]|nr:hypothetical protein LTR72_012461 [Exophiala xenobiotica]KAK5444235.1 hypothetical protein LTR55_012291 [Exophiala xenobiotica]